MKNAIVQSSTVSRDIVNITTCRLANWKTNEWYKNEDKVVGEIAMEYRLNEST